MHMLNWPRIVVHVQRLVRVMVVIGILRMNDQVPPITKLLHHKPRAQHCQ